ncbi:DHH family phosphoesterase [Membranicola marinus]|uniref:DHH family phosphoesterase n=1 Tax=Membranihabitans marinus TaxID=1227546 RepID=A0A953LEN4_9BACT|nr:DHH family phosphoesterase [Membranihabitans marinus]MBY5960164.1 DHH family phosphoesterase [Membranihabitans marinus]
MPEKGLQDVHEFLSSPRKILIASHRNPDGDALGSSLALARYCQLRGHSVTVAVPSAYPANFDWLPGIKDVLIFDDQEEEVVEKINDAELFVYLDFNHVSRIDKMGEPMAEKDTPVLLIDHHLEPDLSHEYYYVDSTASSTADLLFDVLTRWENTNYLKDELISTCLYTGIITDTGTFAHNTNSRLFGKVSNLLESSIDHIAIQNRINNSLTEKQLRLLGYCLYHRFTLIPEQKTGIIYLNKADYSKFEIERGDTEGIVNNILKINNIKIAAFFTQQPTIVKLSLRSVEDYNVADLARKYYNGGGHKNAAGGSHYKGLKSALELFKKVLPEFVKQHTNE